MDHDLQRCEDEARVSDDDARLRAALAGEPPTTDHPSVDRLVRRAVGALGEAEAEALEAHLGRCTACRAMYVALAEEHQASAQGAAIVPLAPRRVPRLLIAAGAIAAAALLWLALSRSTAPPARAEWVAFMSAGDVPTASVAATPREVHASGCEPALRPARLPTFSRGSVVTLDVRAPRADAPLPAAVQVAHSRDGHALVAGERLSTVRRGASARVRIPAERLFASDGDALVVMGVGEDALPATVEALREVPAYCWWAHYREAP